MSKQTRRADYKRQRAANEKSIMVKRRKLESDTNLKYFRACFANGDFDECERLLAEDKKSVFDYLGQDTIKGAKMDADMLAWLLDRGVNPDTLLIGETVWIPLIEMAVDGPNPYDLCSLLIARNADVNARSSFGSTALMVAARRNDVRTCRLLVDAGASPYIIDRQGNDVLSRSEDSRGWHRPGDVQIREEIDVYEFLVSIMK